MDHELPTEFDLIVIGTGLVESVVSAAASRVGKTVLHIDNNDYYGGLWASFNLETFQKLNEPNSPADTSTNIALEEGETVQPLRNNLIALKDFSTQWHIPELNTDEGDHRWTQEALLNNSRKFNLDVSPKLHFARGSFVELLISSNISRYSEFRSVSRVITWHNRQLEIVPCSRSDVFANNRVTVIEKRMLIKLFTSLDSDDVINGYENKTFKTFLHDKKLTPSLIHYVLYGIAMGTDETCCSDGISRVKRFLNSLGRFGTTPFLYSSYGSGEITQAFCRLSAVFGGIYALNQSLKGLILKDNTAQAVICGSQKIKSTYVVAGAEKAPQSFVKAPHQYISRAIFITDRSILPDEKEHLTLLLYPPENNKELIIVIEAGSLTGTCPKDLYIVHLISKQSTNPEEDFQNCVRNLFDDGSPKILWSAYYSIPDINGLDLNGNVPTNFLSCPGPDLDLDYDFSIKKAEAIFKQVYPDMDFLPRAPDPEEIVIEGGVEAVEGETVVSNKEKPETGERVDDEGGDHETVAEGSVQTRDCEE